MVDMHEYSDFEQRLILTWAQCCLDDFLRQNPNAGGKARSDTFLDAIEGGLYIVRNFRKQFSD